MALDSTMTSEQKNKSRGSKANARYTDEAQPTPPVHSSPLLSNPNKKRKANDVGFGATPTESSNGDQPISFSQFSIPCGPISKGDVETRQLRGELADAKARIASLEEAMANQAKEAQDKDAEFGSRLKNKDEVSNILARHLHQAGIEVETYKRPIRDGIAQANLHATEEIEKAQREANRAVTAANEETALANLSAALFQKVADKRAKDILGLIQLNSQLIGMFKHLLSNPEDEEVREQMKTWLLLSKQESLDTSAGMDEDMQAKWRKHIEWDLRVCNKD